MARAYGVKPGQVDFATQLSVYIVAFFSREDGASYLQAIVYAYIGISSPLNRMASMTLMNSLTQVFQKVK